MSKFKVGDICRYGNGLTALFEIKHVSKLHNGLQDRYYGTQCFGGSVGSYETDTTLASAADLEVWESTTQDRVRCC